MRHLRPHNRTLALLVALLALAGGCGSWDLEPGVLVRNVPLDLAFGRDLSETPAPPAPTPEVTEETIEEIIGSLPVFKQPIRRRVFTSPELCPETDPTETFPDRPLEGQVAARQEDPLQGSYLMAVDKWIVKTDKGDVDLAKKARADNGIAADEPLVADRLVQLRKDETVPKVGYSYAVTDLARLTEIRYFTSAIGEDPVQTPGFHFQELTFFADLDNPERILVVRPPNPLMIMDYPVKYGYSTDARVQPVEVYFDDRDRLGPAPRPNVRQQDPVASAPKEGGAAPTAGTTLTSEATVLPNDQSLDRVFGCGQAADAYRVRWKLTLRGSVNAVLQGTQWFAPQYGGYPVKEQLELTTDLYASEGVTGVVLEQHFMFLEPK